MKITITKISYFLFLLFSTDLFSQSYITRPFPDSINKNKLYCVISSEMAIYVSGLSYLSFIWYKDHERVPFHFYNDWKGYLQMDKAGHAFTAYRESFSSYYALRKAGVEKKKALFFGGPLGFFFQAPIEIFDGLYEGWGFSFGDIVANTAGSLLFTIQEAFFDNQLVLMKFSYSPSGYPKYHPILGENQVESFFLDYNGHTYWLSAHLQGITGFKKIPGWINLALGYSANGMIKEFENPEYYLGQPFPHLDRYRQWILSLDINFTKIPTDKKWLFFIFRSLNLLKFPFPALEYNSIEGLKCRALYF